MGKRHATLQDIIRDRQKLEFVGRKEQMELFQRNFEHAWDDPQRRFIFNVWGHGGVGKSTLLRQFREIALAKNAIIAWTTEAETDVPSVMGKWSNDFRKQEHKAQQFDERYKVYQQKREELEADPDAPQGFSAFAARTLTKVATQAVKTYVPGSDVLMDMVDTDVLAEQAGEWAEYVRKQIRNKDEVRLILEPIKVLTPLFLQDLNAIAADKIVAFFIDTYERTDVFLDQWLIDLLEGRYGELPVNMMIILAGRKELDRDRWSDYVGLLSRMPLETFSEAEAIEYLTLKGITNDQVVEVIVQLSGGLPLLAATLALGSPDDPQLVSSAAETAVERFLKWVDDPIKRKLAEDAALPRYINGDIINVIADEDAGLLLEWLKLMPFVLESPGEKGWYYHEVVRSQLLRHQRQVSMDNWRRVHSNLAEFFRMHVLLMEMSNRDGVRNSRWRELRLEQLYHDLCHEPTKKLDEALAGFLNVLDLRRAFADAWAEVMIEAGSDSLDSNLEAWGHRLSLGLQSYENENYQETIRMFDALLDQLDLENAQKSILLAWRGNTNRLMNNHQQALTDLDRAIELDDKYKWAFVRRATTYERLGNHEQALTDLDHALAIDDRYKLAIVGRGTVYESMGHYEQAMEEYNRALAIDNEYIPAIISRGKVYQSMGNFKQSLVNLDYAIELDDQNAIAYIGRSLVHAESKNYANAVSDLDQAIALDPDKEMMLSTMRSYFNSRLTGKNSDFLKTISDLGDSIPELVQSLGNLVEGINFENTDGGLARSLSGTLGLPESQVTQLLQMIQAGPDSMMRIMNLESTLATGALQSKDNNIEKTISDLDQIILDDPTNNMVLVHRGMAYALIGCYEQALADYDHAIELDNEDLPAILLRGIAYQSMGQYDQSLVDLNRAIEIFEYDSIATIFRGCTYRLLENYDQALVDLNHAIELNEKNSTAFSFRGEVHQSMENFEQALLDFDHAIRLNGTNDRYYYQRGLTLKWLGQDVEADADFGRAILNVQQKIAENPNNWRSKLKLALYHIVQEEQAGEELFLGALTESIAWGLYMQAIYDLDELIELFPSHSQAISIREKLQKRMMEKRKEQ